MKIILIIRLDLLSIYKFLALMNDDDIIIVVRTGATIPINGILNNALQIIPFFMFTKKLGFLIENL